MSKKHTPGPWSYNGKSLAVYAPGIPDFLVANCTPDAVGAPVEESDANARLIAAAPDLLEACRLIAGKMYDASVGWVAVKAAEEAIAKATKENQ